MKKVERGGTSMYMEEERNNFSKKIIQRHYFVDQYIIRKITLTLTLTIEMCCYGTKRTKLQDMAFGLVIKTSLT